MKQDRFSSLIGVVLATYWCIETINNLSLGSWHDPGPGFWPFWGSIILGLLSIAHFVCTGFKKFTDTKEAWYSKEHWKTLSLIFFALIIYAFFLEPLGFIITTFLLLVYLFSDLEPIGWKKAVGLSALVSFLTYSILVYGLSSQLPIGFWGF